MRALPDRILIVTDRHQARLALEATVGRALAGGGRWVWLRDRDLDPAARRELGRSLRRLTQERDASLTIGHDIELAADTGADGVHLRLARDVAEARRRLGSERLIGVSAHSAAEVAEAADRGADYVTLSPIFPTASKPGHGPALGLDGLRAAAGLEIPVLALGGISPATAASCRRAGAAGLAVMGCVMGATSPGRMVQNLRACLESEDGNRTTG